MDIQRQSIEGFDVSGFIDPLLRRMPGGSSRQSPQFPPSHNAQLLTPTINNTSPPTPRPGRNYLRKKTVTLNSFVPPPMPGKPKKLAASAAANGIMGFGGASVNGPPGALTVVGASANLEHPPPRSASANAFHGATTTAAADGSSQQGAPFAESRCQIRKGFSHVAPQQWFICQRCKQLLVLDVSLHNLDVSKLKHNSSGEIELEPEIKQTQTAQTGAHVEQNTCLPPLDHPVDVSQSPKSSGMPAPVQTHTEPNGCQEDPRALLPPPEDAPLIVTLASSIPRAQSTSALVEIFSDRPAQWDDHTSSASSRTLTATPPSPLIASTKDFPKDNSDQEGAVPIVHTPKAIRASRNINSQPSQTPTHLHAPHTTPPSPALHAIPPMATPPFVTLVSPRKLLDSLSAATFGFKRTPQSASTDVIPALRELFCFASDTSWIDNPLCRQCTLVLISEMEQTLKFREDEVLVKTNLLQKISDLSDDTTLDKKIASLEMQVEDLEQELAALDAECKKTEAEQQRTLQTSCKIQTFNQRYWATYTGHHSELQKFTCKLDCTYNNFCCSIEKLRQLNSCNVINDTFHISFSGPYGTINSFKLGNISSIEAMDWPQNNTAWGFLTLLLNTLARILKVKFKRYQLISTGSRSLVLSRKLNETYELFVEANAVHLGRLFWFNNFDRAVVGVSCCVKELATSITSHTDGSFCLPYNIKGEEIDGLSLCMRLNDEVIWTKALKYLLIDCKYLLAALCKQECLSFMKCMC
ncbi:autophagy protein Apg6 family protein [Pelomyxa schiedti]|nr:autophagy protein Apg6 family protein [Pelomyxa schiedti]